MHNGWAIHNLLNQNKTEIIKEYQSTNITAEELSHKWGTSASNMHKFLKQNGCQLKWQHPARYNAKYSVDSHIFDTIDTENKAWRLGFIASDGHISKKNALMFSQSMQQIDGLEHLKVILNSNTPLRYKINKTTTNQYVTLNITSKQLCDSLLKLGLNHQKSNNYDFKKLVSYIPQNLLHHFLRGLFDGDGSIRYYNYPYFKKTQVHVGFTHIYDAVVYWNDYFDIKTKIVKETNLVYTSVTENRYKAEQIYHCLYDDSTIYLNVKKLNFENFLNKFHEEEQM